MTAQSDQVINLILRYIQALQADPDAAPPPGLDAAAAAIARDLAQAYAGLLVAKAQRARIWERALEEVIQDRLAQKVYPTEFNSSIRSNGHHARQETKTMNVEATLVQPVARPRGQATRRGIWNMGLIAALFAVVVGGLLFVNLGDSTLPGGTGSQGTAPLMQPDVTATVEGTWVAPVIVTTADVDVREGPSLEHPVMLTLAAGNTIPVIGRTEDSSWYLVALADGSIGWIATPLAGETPAYEIVGNPDAVAVVTDWQEGDPGFSVTDATATPLVPPPSNATATPSATPSPIMPPTVMPPTVPNVPSPDVVTATPIIYPPTSSVMMFELQIDYTNASQLSEQLSLAADADQVVAWSPDGQWLAVSDNTQITVYQAGDLRAAPQVLEGHTGNILSLAYNPAGTLLASASADGTVRLWTAQTGEFLATLDICESCAVESAAFNPLGTILVVEAEGQVRLWSLPQ